MQISNVSNGYSKVAFGISNNPTEQLNPQTVSKPQAFPATPGAQGLDDEPKKGGFLKKLGVTAVVAAVVAAGLGLLRKYGLKGDINAMTGIKKGLAVAGQWINEKSVAAFNAIKGWFTKAPEAAPSPAPVTPPPPPAA